MKKYLIIFILLLVLLPSIVNAVDIAWVRKDASVATDSIFINWLTDNLGYSITVKPASDWPFTVTGVYDLVVMMGIENIYWSELGASFEDSAQSSTAGFLTIAGSSNGTKTLRYDLRMGDSIKYLAGKNKVYVTDSTHWITSIYVQDSLYIYDAVESFNSLYVTDAATWNLLRFGTSDTSFLSILDSGATNEDGGTNTKGRNAFFGIGNANASSLSFIAEVDGLGLLGRTAAWTALDTANSYFDSIIMFGGNDFIGGWWEIGGGPEDSNTTLYGAGADSSSYKIYNSSWRFGQDGDKAQYTTHMSGIIRIPDEILFNKWDTINYEVLACTLQARFKGLIDYTDEPDSVWDWRVKFTNILKGPFNAPPRKTGGFPFDATDWANRTWYNATENLWGAPNALDATDINLTPIWTADNFTYEDLDPAGEILKIPIDAGFDRVLGAGNNKGFLLYVDTVYNATDTLGSSNAGDCEYAANGVWSVNRSFNDGGGADERPVLMKLVLQEKTADVDSFTEDYLCACDDTIFLDNDSMPYDVSASNVCIALDGNVTSATYGINVGDYDSVAILLREDTLSFGTGEGDHNYGIYTGYGSEYLYIKGGTVLHDVPGASTADTNFCVYIIGVKETFIDSSELVVGGRAGKNIYQKEDHYNLNIRGCVLSSNVYDFRSRCTYDAANIHVTCEHTATGDQFNVRIWNNTITGPHVGISLVQNHPHRPLAYIWGNHITPDARNDQYTYPAGNSCLSSGNAYGINIYGLAAGSYVRNNIIRSGTNYGGSKGILIQGCMGEEGDSIYIDSNDIQVSTGPNENMASGESVGIYFRPSPGDDHTYNTYTAARHNTITVYVDADTNTTYIGRWAEGIRCNFEDSMAWNLVEGNNVDVIRADPDTGDIETSAFSFVWPDTNNANNLRVEGNVVRYNNLNATESPIWIGNPRASGMGGNILTMYGDTISSVRDNDSVSFVFNQTGTYSKHSTNFTAVDFVYQGNSNDASVVKGTFTEDIDTCEAGFPDHGKTMKLARQVTINVKRNGANVASANVYITKNSGADTIFSSATDASGNTTDTTVYKFFGYDPFPEDACVIEDSLFDDFVIIVKEGADSTGGAAVIEAAGSTSFNYDFETPIGAGPCVIIRSH